MVTFAAEARKARVARSIMTLDAQNRAQCDADFSQRLIRKFPVKLADAIKLLLQGNHICYETQLKPIKMLMKAPNVVKSRARMKSLSPRRPPQSSSIRLCLGVAALAIAVAVVQSLSTNVLYCLCIAAVSLAVAGRLAALRVRRLGLVSLMPPRLVHVLTEV